MVYSKRGFLKYKFKYQYCGYMKYEVVFRGKVIEQTIVDRKLVDVPEEKETSEQLKRRSRKPPSEGKCIKCRLIKPLNRQKVCYRCFVIINLEKDGWKEGQNHPSTCGCDLDCAAEKKSFGN